MCLQYIEFFTTIISLCTLWLGIKQYIANWPISIVITLINLLIYHQGVLYDRWISAGISITFSIYGWYQWRYGGPRHTILKRITTTSFAQFISIVILILVCFIIMSKLLIDLQSALPYQGALSISLLIIGLWMTANKKLEAYIAWFLLNIVSVYIHYYKGYYWFVGKYLIYLISSIYGYIEWNILYLSYRKKSLSL